MDEQCSGGAVGRQRCECTAEGVLWFTDLEELGSDVSGLGAFR